MTTASTRTMDPSIRTEVTAEVPRGVILPVLALGPGPAPTCSGSWAPGGGAGLLSMLPFGILSVPPFRLDIPRFEQHLRHRLLRPPIDHTHTVTPELGDQDITLELQNIKR